MPPAARLLGSSQTRPLMFQRPQGPLAGLAAAGHKGHTGHFHRGDSACRTQQQVCPGKDTATHPAFAHRGKVSLQRCVCMCAVSHCSRQTKLGRSKLARLTTCSVRQVPRRHTPQPIRRFTTHARWQDAKRRAVATAGLPLPYRSAFVSTHKQTPFQFFRLTSPTYLCAYR